MHYQLAYQGSINFTTQHRNLGGKDVVVNVGTKDSKMLPIIFFFLLIDIKTRAQKKKKKVNKDKLICTNETMIDTQKVYISFFH